MLWVAPSASVGNPHNRPSADLFWPMRSTDVRRCAVPKKNTTSVEPSHSELRKGEGAERSLSVEASALTKLVPGRDFSVPFVVIFVALVVVTYLTSPICGLGVLCFVFVLGLGA